MMIRDIGTILIYTFAIIAALNFFDVIAWGSWCGLVPIFIWFIINFMPGMPNKHLRNDDILLRFMTAKSRKRKRGVLYFGGGMMGLPKSVIAEAKHQKSDSQGDKLMFSDMPCVLDKFTEKQRNEIIKCIDNGMLSLDTVRAVFGENRRLK